MADTLLFDNFELQSLLNDKEQGYNYRERRSTQWNENYQLYRDKVTVNRLTQRQSVNIPLMKTVLRSVLKDVDDMPVIEFQNIDNDKQAEIFFNKYWELTLKENNAEIQDVVDKKQDFFFGRTFDSWQIEDGKIVFDIEDPEDILVDRFVNPYDIDSSRFLIHLHIFRPLSYLQSNLDFDQEKVKELVDFFKSKLGIIKAKKNEDSLLEKNKKMSDMGVTDIDDPVLGETYVELTMYFRFRDKGEEWIDNQTGKKEKTDAEQIIVYVEAENQCILMKKPQEKIIGVTKDHYWRNHYRYNSWGDDIDKQDFWTDGLADIIRVPNQVLNSWFSQLVENRTLRNFGMHYYNALASDSSFTPSTFNPVPWGWYPIPGKPSDVIQKVDIPDLSESIDEMNYVVDMVQKATASTDTQQGVVTPGNKTKFEINATLVEAKERTQGMSKFYTKAWEDRANKFLKLIEAGKDKLDTVKIYSEGKNNNKIYSREINYSDWMTKSGYKVKIWTQDQKKNNDIEVINKLQLIVASMPDNLKLRELYNRKLLEYADLKPEEIQEIMLYEEKKQSAIDNNMMVSQNVNNANSTNNANNTNILPQNGVIRYAR